MPDFDALADELPNFAEVLDDLRKQLVLCMESDDPLQLSPVLLLGDSHSAALSKEVSAALADQGIGVYRVSYSACLPLRDFRRKGQEPKADCARFLEDVLTFADTAGIETVVLTARFPLYLHGNGFDNGEGGVETRRDTRVDVVWSAQTSEAGRPGGSREEDVLAAFEHRLLALADRFNLVLVNPIPEAGWDVPQLAAKRRLFGYPDLPVTTSWHAYRARAGQIADLFRRLASEKAGIQVAPVDRALCDGTTGRCVNADARGIYYFDDDHLSTDGARLVAPVVLAAIRRSLDEDRVRQALNLPASVFTIDELGKPLPVGHALGAQQQYFPSVD
jgi:hypothetical protein